MLYRKMGATGDKVSILGFGAMRLPLKANGKIDKNKATELLRHAIDNGITYIDTAWPYHSGESESFLGNALKDGYREKVKIATKLPHWLCKSKEEMLEILDRQRVNLNVETIDYYLIHNLVGETWEKALKHGVQEFLDEAKRSGRVKNVGFSFHGQRHEFRKIVDDYPWDMCQIQYNILDENYQAGKEGLKYATEKGLGVVIMEPLRGGMLARKVPKEVQKNYDSSKVKRSNAEWALRWLWNQPEVVTVLSGMNNYDHVDENIRIANSAKPNGLTDEENRIIKNASTAFKMAMKVPCTGCQYCMPCPKNVNIADCFAMYNSYNMLGSKLVQKVMYNMFLGDSRGNKADARASQCIDCKVCVKKCPQQIDIPTHMKAVKKQLEGPFMNGLSFIVGKLMMREGKKRR